MSKPSKPLTRSTLLPNIRAESRPTLDYGWDIADRLVQGSYLGVTLVARRERYRR